MSEKFQSKVPPQFLKGKTDDERWLYEQQSIQAQQNEHISNQNETILTRLAENNDRLTAHEKEDLKALEELSGRIAVYDRIRERFSGAKIIMSLICFAVGTLLVVPFLGALFLSWVGGWKLWK